MQIGDAQLEGCLFSSLLDVILYLALDLLHRFLNSSGMDPTVGDESLERLFRDGPPDRIEAGQDHRLGGIIHDHIDPRRALESPDVSSLPADDPPLHVFVR